MVVSFNMYDRLRGAGEPPSVRQHINGMGMISGALLHGMLMLLLNHVYPPSLADIQGVWIGKEGNFFMKVVHHSIQFSGSPSPWETTINGQVVPRYPPPSRALPPSEADSVWISPSGALVVRPGPGIRDTIGYLSYDNKDLTIRDSRESPPLLLRRTERDTSLHLKNIQITLRSARSFDLQLTSQEIILCDQTNGQRLYSRGASNADLFAKCQQTIQESDFKSAKGSADTLSPYADEAYVSLVVSYNDTTRILFFYPGGMPAELSPMVPLLLAAMESSSFVSFDTLFVFQSRLRSCFTFLDSLQYMESLYPSLYRAPRYPDGIQPLEDYIRSRVFTHLDRKGTYCVDLLLDESGSIVATRDIDLLMRDSGLLPYRYLRAAELQNELKVFQQALATAPRYLPALWEGKPAKAPLSVCFYLDE
jgi:hypothetical protein